MQEKQIKLVDAFRTILRAHYLQWPWFSLHRLSRGAGGPIFDAVRITKAHQALADEIQSIRYISSASLCCCHLRRLDPEAQAADEALAALIDAIVSQSIRLHGRLDGNLPADIDPTEVVRSGILVFDNALEVYGERGRMLRTYQNVHCYAAEIATLIGAAENDAADPEQPSPLTNGAAPLAVVPSVAMTKSGVRMKTQADAETAFADFIKGLPKEPRIRKEDLEKLALQRFQGLSGKAFGRQWDLHIHSEWKSQGAPRKTSQR